MNYLRSKTGYTLIELVVAIAIFVTVVVITTTILINVLQEHRRTAQMRVLLDQTRTLLDTMYVELSSAQADYRGSNTDCLGAGATVYPRVFQQNSSDELLFIAEDGTCTGYALDAGQIKKIVNAETMAGSTLINMTDGSIQVNVLNFKIFEDGLISQQPQVEIRIEVESRQQDDLPVIALQKTVSHQLVSNFNTCSVGIGDDGIFCPFREEDLPPGSVVVNFLEHGEHNIHFCYSADLNACIRSNQDDDDRAKTHVVTTNIPSDTYKVLAVGFDKHVESFNPFDYSSDIQNNEQFDINMQTNGIA